MTQESMSSQKFFQGNWEGRVTPEIILTPNRLTILAGPCMCESLELGLNVGRFLKQECNALGLNYVFKSSYDKANRTSHTTTRGPGLKEGLKRLAQIKETLGAPILTDVHSPEECALVAEVCDILQIPAFLCEQRELLLAAARTGKTIQIKKGQHSSPETMIAIANFLVQAGNPKVMLCERGSTYGYNNLAVDFRNLLAFRSAGFAAVFDATHAAMLPGAGGGKSSGTRDVIPGLARAAVAVGIDALFLEVHENPEQALSDAATQLPFSMARDILRQAATLSRKALEF